MHLRFTETLNFESLRPRVEFIRLATYSFPHFNMREAGTPCPSRARPRGITSLVYAFHSCDIHLVE